MSWLIPLSMNWTGFIYGDENLNYMNIFLLFFIPFLILSFSMAIYLVLMGYVLSLVVYIYKKMNNVPEDILSNSWHKLRHYVANCFIIMGKIMFDHEIIGMEHLPNGPGIIIFYHGLLDIDYVLLFCKLYNQEGKVCSTVTDKSLFLLPGLKPLLQLGGCIPGRKAECLEMLKKGCLLGIAPGGVREAFFSDQNYELIWGKRIGFAQLALEAKVPIIPMFTQNIQEASRGFGRTRLLRWLYEKTRIVFLAVCGMFPVKLRTYLGEPIPYDPNMTAQELAEKTKVAVENLRDRYQKIPGNILRALKERFDKYHKED